MKRNCLIFAIVLIISPATSQGQQVRIDLDPTVRRMIGGESHLDRSRFFNLHSRGNDAEHQALYNDYQVHQSGRGFWSPLAVAKQQTGQVGVYPAFEAKEGNGVALPVTEFVATDHPRNAYKEGIDIKAAADWVVEYYRNRVDASGRPAFYEPMNEPFVHARDFYPEPDWTASAEARVRGEMARLFGEIGARIHNTPELANMKVLGYSSAYPSMEIKDFSHWESNQKMFMDVAGAHMDGFAIHLYDGINVTGQHSRRSGSNSEAILDLVETYSYVKWDSVKPLAITEFGGIERGYPEGYSDIKSAQTLRSINHLLFNLLERQDRLLISIPFITGKAEWHINEANNYQPYGATLWIPTNIGVPLNQIEGWRYTARIYFYALWKDVTGDRILARSDHPDVQSQAFVENDQLFVALNNLDDHDQIVTLNFLRELPTPENIEMRSLKIHSGEDPEYIQLALQDGPAQIKLIPGETVILAYRFAEPLSFDNTIRAKRYYTKKHLQPIVAGEEMTFEFKEVVAGSGYAYLRMGIGRKHDRSKQPEVKVNGRTIYTPDNWAGYDQADRDDFFGMIEIPFPPQYLKTNNTVTVKFPDSGGRLSSLILEVEKYDRAVEQVTPTREQDRSEIRSIYPNPFRDRLHLELPEEERGKAKILLFDSLGRQVWSQAQHQTGTWLLLPPGNLPSGLYHLQVNTGSRVFTGKVEKF